MELHVMANGKGEGMGQSGLGVVWAHIGEGRGRDWSGHQEKARQEGALTC